MVMSAQEIEQIKNWKAICKTQKRELSDKEFKKASKLNWKLTCPSTSCYQYRGGQSYDPATEQCLECQTDLEPMEAVPMTDALKVGSLEGVRYLKRVVCSCGASWERGEDKVKAKRERQRFIAQHAEHNLRSARFGSWTSVVELAEAP
jgi:hypothetical protein